MDSSEILVEIRMTYYELIEHLRNKYGEAKCDYFHTPDCNSRNADVSRTDEGLYCHHIDEDKGSNLSNINQAKMQPFEWQKKERLIYCNAIEHLILHIKIAVLRQKEKLRAPYHIGLFFSTGGIFQICAELNCMFAKNGTTTAWRKKCYKLISENYRDYISLIVLLFRYIDHGYIGDKTKPQMLKEGAVWKDDDGDAVVLKVADNRCSFLLKKPNGETRSCRTGFFIPMLSFHDAFDVYIANISSGFREDLYHSIYNDVVNQFQSVKEDYEPVLEIDYKGYGYAQYADIELQPSFNAKNADHYLSKALPMHCKQIVSLDNKRPVFWSGDKMPQVAMEHFFVLRFKAVFAIKNGQEPFVRYRELDARRRKLFAPPSESMNLLSDGWIVLETSDYFDKKTGERCSEYSDLYGNVCEAYVTLTLGREDLLLFKERYDVRKIQILDGCYFVDV